MEPRVSGYCGKTTSEGLAIPMTTKMTSPMDNTQQTRPPRLSESDGGQATDAKGVVRRLYKGYRLR